MSEHKLSETYNELLKKIRHARSKGEKIGVEYWEKIHQMLVNAEHLNEEESKIVVEALQRDMGEARYVLKDIGKTIGDWLSYDAALIEDQFEDWLELVADDTLVDWIHLRQQWQQNDHYQTGDLVGIGEYTCTNCGHLIHFHKAGHIAPCSHCQGSDFKREPQN